MRNREKMIFDNRNGKQVLRDCPYNIALMSYPTAFVFLLKRFYSLEEIKDNGVAIFSALKEAIVNIITTIMASLVLTVFFPITVLYIHHSARATAKKQSIDLM